MISTSVSSRQNRFSDLMHLLHLCSFFIFIFKHMNLEELDTLFIITTASTIFIANLFKKKHRY